MTTNIYPKTRGTPSASPLLHSSSRPHRPSNPKSLAYASGLINILKTSAHLSRSSAHNRGLTHLQLLFSTPQELNLPFCVDKPRGVLSYERHLAQIRMQIDRDLT